MSSSWGGTGAFIAEGLKRAEEDRKRKEKEEEARRRQEEARRNSLIPQVGMGDPNWRVDQQAATGQHIIGPPTREESSRVSRPKLDLPPSYQPTPLPGIQNPNRISTAGQTQAGISAPQLGSTQPSNMTVSAPTQPIVEERPAPMGPMPNPRRTQLTAMSALNMQAPLLNAQPQLPKVLPQLGTAMAPAIQQGLTGIGQGIADGISSGVQGFNDLLKQGTEAATNFGNNIVNTWNNGTPESQAYANQRMGLLTHEQLMEKNGPPTRWQDVTTPAGAIAERYKWNLIDKPQDSTDQVLKKFAPVIYNTMKVVEAVGAIDEVVGTFPNPLQNLGVPGETLGEARAIAIRSRQAYEDQYTSYILQDYDIEKPWWEVNPLQGGPNKKVVSPPDIMSAIALAENELFAALAPTAAQLQSASPAAIASAQAQTKAMAHHGIPAMTQMFDDILELGTRTTELRDLAQQQYDQAMTMESGPDREAALFAAASYGAQAKQLAYTHPAELYDRNMNLWNALPFEAAFGLTGLVSEVMDIAKLTPLARRTKQGTKLADVTVDQAKAAMESGSGIGRTWEQKGQEFINSIPILKQFWQTAQSKASVDTRSNFRTIGSLIKDFPEKEDLVKIITAYVTDPLKLLTEGIPAAELKSPVIKWSHPGAEGLIGPMQDIVRFGPADLSSYDAVRAQASLAPIADQIASMVSLQGTGLVEPGVFLSELYTLLVRGAGETHGVGTLSGVPINTASVTTNLVGDGTATIQYLDKARNVVEETAAMGLVEANKRVKEIKSLLKSGQELTTNFLQEVGNVQRSALGLTTVNFGFDNLINDSISNRVIATADGVWSWKGYDQSLAYLQGITGVTIPFDEVARATTEGMNTAGGVSSQFSQLFTNNPVTGFFQRLRNADDKRMRVVVYSTAHQNWMTTEGWARMAPAVEDILKQSGWTDPQALQNASAAVFDAGMKGGWTAASKTFYDIANGSNPVSMASIAPHYRDIYGQFADELDNLVKSVTPETVSQMQQQLADIQQRASAAINGLTQEYVSSPGRSYYTHLDDQKAIVNLQTTFEKISRELGENFAAGTYEPLKEIGGVFKNINANVLQVIQMAGNNPDAPLYIQKLWKDIVDLKDGTRTTLDRMGDHLLTFPYGTSKDQKARAFLEFRQLQESAYSLLNTNAGQLIDQARVAIANAVPFDRTNTPFAGAGGSGLEALGHNIQDVFTINARNPGIADRDPNFDAAEAAGRKGTDAFLAQMMMILQANPTQAGFDHFLSAMDDVGKYRNKIIPGMKTAQDNLVREIRALEAAGKTSGLWKKWKQVTKLRNDAWVEYYEQAYSRYQAASALMAQAAGGITNFPTFIPTGNWAIPSWNGKPVTLQGINVRNAKEYIIVTPTGNRMAIPKMHVPEETIKQWEDMVSNLYGTLASQVSAQAANLFQNGTGDAAIDALIANIRKATKNPVFDAVRKDMKDYMANPQGHGDLGSSVGAFIGNQINQIASKVKNDLPNIAQRNATRNTPISMDGVRQFSTNVKPLWDNIMAGANKTAEQAVSFSLVDFINTYGPDVLAGVFVPYSYWATRQGKNMLERLLFNPRMFGVVAGANKAIEGTNRANGQPQRYNNSIDTGIDMPTIDAFGMKLFEGADTIKLPNYVPRWAPFGLSYIFGGWADMDKANQGADYLINQMESSGMPGWGDPKTLAARAMLASEVMSASGASLFPWWKDAIMAMNNRTGEINLSNYGSIGQIVNDYSGAKAGGYVPFFQSHANPYVVARSAANEGFMVDESAGPINAAGQAEFEGRELAPEFQRDHPDAPAQWAGAYREEFLEQLVMDMLGFFIPGTPSVMDLKEPERLAAQKFQSDMGYGPDNPTGSRERNQRYDENSPNYIPGLSAGQSTYSVIGEGVNRELLTPAPPNYPYTPDYETRKLDEAVVLGEYLDKRDEIYDRYKQEEVEAINSHPEWTGEKVDSTRSDFYQSFYDRREAELSSLESAYPTVANKFKEPTSASLRGANPLETTDAALDRLIQQAKDENESLNPGDYPAGADRETIYAYNKQKETFDLAVSSRLQELMNDPQAASSVVFGRPLNTNGPLPGQSAPRVGPEDRTYYAPRQGKATLATETTGEIGTNGIPGGEQVSRPTNSANATARASNLGQQQAATQAITTMDTTTLRSVDPNNQWGTQMQAAEQQYGLPAGLLEKVAREESGFSPTAKSGAGAVGLMQIMPATWEEWAPKVGATDPNNPEDSIKVGAAYLDWLSKTLPADQRDIRSIMIAYNWGIGNVLEKGLEKAPPETTAYADRIANSGGGSVMLTPQQTEAAVASGQQFIRPIVGGADKVTQGYGANVENYREWNDEHGHEGIDYGVPVGTPVVAAADGAVVFAGTGDGFGNYGNYVVVQHPNGYKSYYAHLDGFDVEVGDTVTQGQPIAKSGNSGRSTGPHLHFSLRLDGDTTGPYGMVDPTDFILGRAGVTQQAAQVPSAAPASSSTTQVANAPVAPTTQPAVKVADAKASPIVSETHNKNGDSVSVTIAQPGNPPSNSGAVNWGVGDITAEQALQQQGDQYKSPEKIALDASVDEAWAHSYDRIAKTYPDHATLFDRYQGVNDEDRPDWRNANPMIRALNLLVYNEKEFDEVEKMFGGGIVADWANIPRGANIGEAAGDYYRANPPVFLAKAWIQGRPQPYDEDAEYDPTKAVGRDFGKDYATAKEMFGDNIWDIVKEYYTVPKYIQGGDNTAWIAFKEKYPQYDEWRKWWYALMGDQTGTSGQRGSGSFSGGFNGFDPSQGEHPQYIKGVEARRFETPSLQRNSGSSGDWQRFMGLSKLGLKNPRK